MNMKPAEEQLSAYLDNELDSQQRAEIERSLELDPALRDTLVNLREVRSWIGELPSVEPTNPPKSIAEMLSAQASPKSPASQLSTTTQNKRFFRENKHKRILSLAAVGIALIGTTLWWLSQNDGYKLAQAPPTTSAPAMVESAAPKSSANARLANGDIDPAMKQDGAPELNAMGSGPTAAPGEAPLEADALQPAAPTVAALGGAATEKAMVEANNMPDIAADGGSGGSGLGGLRSDTPPRMKISSSAEAASVPGEASPLAMRSAAPRTQIADANRSDSSVSPANLVDSATINLFLIDQPARSKADSNAIPKTSATDSTPITAESKPQTTNAAEENNREDKDAPRSADIIVTVTRVSVTDMALDDFFEAIRSNDLPLQEISGMNFSAAILRSLPKELLLADKTNNPSTANSESAATPDEALTRSNDGDVPSEPSEVNTSRILSFNLNTPDDTTAEPAKRRLILGVTPSTWTLVRKYFETRGYPLEIREAMPAEQAATSLASQDKAPNSVADATEPQGTIGDQKGTVDSSDQDRIFILLEGK